MTREEKEVAWERINDQRRDDKIAEEGGRRIVRCTCGREFKSENSLGLHFMHIRRSQEALK